MGLLLDQLQSKTVTFIKPVDFVPKLIRELDEILKVNQDNELIVLRMQHVQISIICGGETTRDLIVQQDGLFKFISLLRFSKW